MKYYVGSVVCIVLSLCSHAACQNLLIPAGGSHTAMGDEVFDLMLIDIGGTLTIPAGTSVTLNSRSVNDGGTIILDGGDFTVNDRFDFGRNVGGTLQANSGTFRVLNDIDAIVGWTLPDNPPNNEEVAQIIIGDAEVFSQPDIFLVIDRFARVTFLPGGSGFLEVVETRPISGTCVPAGGSGLDAGINCSLADPNDWLTMSTFPNNEGFGLFAPEGESISITEDPITGNTIVTSISLLASSGNLFTWGQDLADGSWSNSAGWRENGNATSNIPILDDEVALRADPVQVQSGTVRVDTADQGAWSLTVDSGGTTVISNSNTLRIAEITTINDGGKIEVSNGGTLTADLDLVVGAGGMVELNDGTATVGRDTAVQGTVAFIGTGTDSGSGPLDGDYNNDGAVNAADYPVWRDGNSPDSTQAGYDLWKANYGATGTVGNPLSSLSLGTGTLANVEVSSSGLINNSSEVTVGQLTMGSTSLLQKQGGGTLILEQSGVANDLAAGSQLRLVEGATVALNDATNNALDDSTVNLDGGELVLSSTGGAVPFDSPVVVRSDSSIRATQSGSGAVADETVTLGGTNGITASSGIVTLRTGSGYTLNLAADVSGPGRLDFDEAANVQVASSVAPAGVGFIGNSSNVIVSGGSISPTSTYYFNPSGTTQEMTVAFDIDGAREVIIGDLDLQDGSVGFTGALDHTGATRIQRGALRLGGTDNAPSASNIVFDAIDFDRSAVVQSSEATYTPTIGTAPGNISWNGAGGFASGAGGAGTTVTVNGGAALDWENDLNGQALQLGSTTANAPVVLTNDINLGSAAERAIMVANNQGTNADIAEISGVISSAGGTTDLLRVNLDDGSPFRQTLLVLSGTNTFDNTLRLDGSSVFAVEGVGLPTDANLQFSSGNPARETVFLTNGTFTRNVGTGAGEVFWNTEDEAAGDGDAEAGGFAARGGDLTVTLNGGATIAWVDPSGFNNHDSLQLGSQYADGVVTFTNSIDAADDMGERTDRDINIFDNPDSPNDSVVIDGDLSNLDGIRFAGNGRVEVNGDIDNLNELRTLGGNVVLVLNGDQLTPSGDSGGGIGGDVDVQNASTIILNGTVNVGGDVQFGGNAGGPSLGGSGQINMFNGGDGTVEIEENANLRPGPDVNGIGTLSINLAANANIFGSSNFFMQPESTYHFELSEDSGSVVIDSVDLDASESIIAGALALQIEDGVGWEVDVSALADLAGMVSPSDEFDLFTFSSAVDLLDYDTDQFDFDGPNFPPILGGSGQIMSATVVSSSGDFDVSSAEVRYDVTSGGRVFVTGLSFVGGGAGATVPEPTTCLLAALGILGMLTGRRPH